MTAARLHSLFASTTDERTSYEGGFDTNDGRATFHVRSDADDIDVALHCQLSAGAGRGVSSWFKSLGPGEARELALALERAADAAEAARAAELGRTG